MTIEQFQNIIKENNIPLDAKLQSDSGWEWMGVYYNQNENTIIFTQTGSASEHEYYDIDGILILNGINKQCVDCAIRIECYCEHLYIPSKDTTCCDYYKKKQDKTI